MNSTGACTGSGKRSLSNADLFASYLPDYLHRTRVGTTTPPPPPPPGAIVYGYRATEADFRGGELEVVWQARCRSWCRLTACSRRGHRPNAHRRLPEIRRKRLNLRQAASGRRSVSSLDRIRRAFHCCAAQPGAR